MCVGATPILETGKTVAAWLGEGGRGIMGIAAHPLSVVALPGAGAKAWVKGGHWSFVQMPCFAHCFCQSLCALSC